MVFYISPLTSAPRSPSIFDLMDYPDDDDLFGDFLPFKRRRSCLAMEPSFALETLLASPCRRPRKQPLARRRQQDSGFSAAVPTLGFRPDEVTTSVDKDARTVRVTGTSEHKSDDGSFVSKRHFERTFTVPESCDMNALDLALAKDGSGMLRITVPAREQEKPKEVCHKSQEEEKGIEDEKAKKVCHDEAEEKKVDAEEKKEEEKGDNKEKEEKFSLSLPLDPKTDPGSIALEVDSKTRELTVKTGVEGEMTTHRVPEDYDLDRMTSAFDPEKGTLHITAPIKEKEKKDVPIVIEIH